MLRKTAVVATSTILVGCAYTTYQRRPFSTFNEPELYHHDHQLLHPVDREKSNENKFRSFQVDTISSKIVRSLTLSAVTGLCRAYLSTCNVEIINLDKFHAILNQSWEAAQRQDYENGRPVLTVSNHMSTIDDPIIISRIAPMAMLAPSGVKRHRWGGCSEEICFKTTALASFFGAGKVLPIWRGGGLQQEMFEELGMHLQPGGWVHLFPEGGICQHRLNRSDVPVRRRTYMRWGVGKMIAKSKHRPIIVPFFHSGMEKALPLDEETGATLRWAPKMGVEMRIVFGDPIVVDDLLDAFVAKYGREGLETPWEGQGVEGGQVGEVEEEEHVLELYAALTERVHLKMQELDERVVWDGVV